MSNAYTWFQRGTELLEAGHPHAAIVALQRARDLEPGKASICEALARSYFNAGQLDRACAEFAAVVEIDPVNDYAHFGLGLCLLRAGERDTARGHLKLAVAMRPESDAYRRALARAGG